MDPQHIAHWAASDESEWNDYCKQCRQRKPQTSKEDGKSLTKKVDKNNIHFSILKSTNSQVAEGGKPQDLAPQYPWWLRGQAYSGS